MKSKQKGDFLIQKVLRLKKEPCDYFSEAEIHQVFMKKAPHFMRLLERFYRAWHQDETLVTLPHKQVFTTEGYRGDFRVMPCIIQDFERKLIKAVKVIGSNIEQRKVKDKISVGKALLLHPQDNFVQAVFDVGSLSSFRTAAISVLAYKYLSGKGSRRTGIIGAGRVGFYTALILHKWLGMRKIYLSDANAKQLSNFLKGTALSLPKLKVTAGTLSELSRGSDALFLTTNTRMPILSDENAGSVKFISSIGADSNTQSELEASILKGRRTFTDSKSGLRFGDLKHWLGKGLIHEGEITELRDVNGAQTTIKTKSLFVSTGIAVHDALACQFLFDHLRRR